MESDFKKLEKIPETEFLTLKQCVTRLGCEEDLLITYIRQGDLSIYILVEDKYLITYTLDADGERIEPKEFISHKTGGVLFPFRMLLGHYYRIDNKYLGKIIAEGKSVIDNVYDSKGTIHLFDEKQKKITVSKGSLYLAVPEVSEFYYKIYPQKDVPFTDSLSACHKIQTNSAPRTRRSELHDCIGKVIVELRGKNKNFPCASDVWRALKYKINNDDQFSCIQSIELNKEKNEGCIYWRSIAGTEQTMLKRRFCNVVSEFKRGKKSLPVAA